MRVSTKLKLKVVTSVCRKHFFKTNKLKELFLKHIIQVVYSVNKSENSIKDEKCINVL